MRIITRVSSCNPQSKASEKWVNSHSAQPTGFLTEYMLNAPLAIPPKQGQSVQQGVCKIRLVGHKNAAHRNDVQTQPYLYTLSRISQAQNNIRYPHIQKAWNITR